MKIIANIGYAHILNNARNISYVSAKRRNNKNATEILKKSKVEVYQVFVRDIRISRQLRSGVLQS